MKDKSLYICRTPMSKENVLDSDIQTQFNN